MSIYEHTIKTADNKERSLGEFKGNVLLIVNTASKCGFTPQYTELQQLYNDYHDQGLEILAFPCDQFAHQEPGSDAEIQQFCQINYGLTFPVYAKIDVNGATAHPLFTELRKKTSGILGDAIKWNFTKFLITRSGQVHQRYAPTVKPSEMKDDIIQLLNEKIDG
jgi:glutathione peroxidase